MQWRKIGFITFNKAKDCYEEKKELLISSFNLVFKNNFRGKKNVINIILFYLSISHAVSAVCSDAVVGINFSGDDPDVEVVLRALSPVRALTEGTGADLIGRGAARVFPDTEQTARFFTLASQFLKR